uniref:ATP-dependent DNA helicase n=1 Tax=Octopus bimaculoides TaxID=37653 RepID=A0A0L8HXE6_OCTBM
MTILIIVDEVSHGDKLIYECLDRSLHDTRAKKSLFEGVCVLFVGDRKQILSVVKRGSRARIVQVTLKTLYIWRSVTELSLKKTMRVQNSSDANFATYLSDIVSGQCSFSNSLTNVIRNKPDYVLEMSSISEICKFVSYDLSENDKIASWLCSRAVIDTRACLKRHLNIHKSEKK